MVYCKDALRLMGVKVVCGKGCPIFENCPRLIIEDATDEAIDKAIIRLIEIIGVSRESN